jgi:hypothetical protein
VAELYGAGAAMGFTPQEVDRMSIWQFAAVASGFARANSASSDKLSQTEKDSLFEWIDSGDAVPRRLTTMTWQLDAAGRLIPWRQVTFDLN